MAVHLLRSISSCIVVAMALTFAQTAEAGCNELIKESQLPMQVPSPLGNEVSYDYDLATNQYYVAWRGAQSGRVEFGPFALQENCSPDWAIHENGDFLILEGFCGDGCWYLRVLSLQGRGVLPIGSFEIVNYAMAFDPRRSLVAYYHSQDTIRVQNLFTSYEQTIPTAYKCSVGPTPCFGFVEIKEDTLEYVWNHSTGYEVGYEETLRSKLDERLKVGR